MPQQKTLIFFYEPTKDLAVTFYEQVRHLFPSGCNMELLVDDADVRGASIRDNVPASQVITATEEKWKRYRLLPDVPRKGWEARLSNNILCKSVLYDAVREDHPDAMVYGIDDHFSREYETSLQCQNLVAAMVHLHNENIAKHLLHRVEQKQSNTVQLAFINRDHFEIEYDLLAERGYEFIDKHFCFFYLNKDDQKLSVWTSIANSADRQLFPFKTAIIDIATVSADDLSQQIWWSRICKQLFLGAREPALVSDIIDEIKRLRLQEESIKQMLQRMGIICSTVKLILDGDDLLNDKMIAVITNLFSNETLVALLGADSLHATLQDALQQSQLSAAERQAALIIFLKIVVTFREQGLLGSLQVEEFTCFVPATMLMMPKTEAAMAACEQRFLDSLRFGEFTERQSADMLIASESDRRAAVPESQASSSCAAFFKAVGVTVVAAAVAAAAVAMDYR